MATQVEIILMQDKKGIGLLGQTKKVKAGYANYLIASNIAALYTPEQEHKFAQLRKKRAKQQQTIKEDAQILQKEINGKSISIKRKANKKDQLYGAVTIQDLIDTIQQTLKVQLEKHVFSSNLSLKSVGKHDILLTLFEDVEATIELTIVSENPPEPDQKKDKKTTIATKKSTEKPLKTTSSETTSSETASAETVSAETVSAEDNKSDVITDIDDTPLQTSKNQVEKESVEEDTTDSVESPE